MIYVQHYLAVSTYVPQPGDKSVCLNVTNFFWKGGATLQLAVIAMLYRPLKPKDSKKTEEKGTSCKDILNVKVFKNKYFVMLCINNFILCIGMSVVMVHMSAFATSHGIETTKSALLFSAMGGCGGIGRLAFGLICQKKWFSATCLYTHGFFWAGLATILAPLYPIFPWLLGYSCLFGFLTACFGSMLPIMITEILDLSLLNSGYGYVLLFEGLGTVLGGPLAGKMITVFSFESLRPKFARCLYFNGPAYFDSVFHL